MSTKSITKTICRGALFLGLLVGSTHADVAAAYWQSGGTATGDAQVIKPLSVNQTADLGAGQPRRPRPDAQRHVRQPQRPARPRLDRPRLDRQGHQGPRRRRRHLRRLRLHARHRTIAVAADVPSGRGTGSWTGGTVAFNNKPGVDQNACQGATVKLGYTTS